MILIDTSVWIEYFQDNPPYAEIVESLILKKQVCTCEIIIMEILQGIKSDKEFEIAKSFLTNLPILKLSNTDSYIEVANIYRKCRKAGITIRKSIDCIIAQICLENNVSLFHNDKDFDQIQKCYDLKFFNF